MASIKLIKVRGNFNKNKPKVMFFNNDNFDKYTTQKYGKYNVVLVGDYQKKHYLDNKIKAYNS